MAGWSRFVGFVLLGLALAGPAGAQEAAPLVPFGSPEGVQRLGRNAASPDFATLANQFEPQSNAAFCGPTSAAIVLNALRAGRADLPRDRSRLRPEQTPWLRPGADLSVARFTQDGVVERGAKPRAQVLGEPVMVGDKPRSDGGYQLRQFDEMLRANGASTRLVVVAQQTLDEIRADMAANLARGGDYVIVNYRREVVGQRGGGHISPLAAYDAPSDSVLVLDVNPSAAGWVWMPLATLVAGMRTFDTVENRGYVVVLPD